MKIRPQRSHPAIRSPDASAIDLETSGTFAVAQSFGTAGRLLESGQDRRAHPLNRSELGVLMSRFSPHNLTMFTISAMFMTS